MTRDPIFIRVDATSRSGYERLARCSTLAAALQRRRRPTFFLSELEPPSLAFNLKRGGNDWIGLSNPAGSRDDLAEVMREMHRLQPGAVILDADVPQDYLDALHRTGVLVVSLDHLSTLRFPTGLLVNPLLGPCRENYEFNPGTQILLGRRYVQVRPEIRRHRPTRAQEPAPLPTPNGKNTAGTFRALVAFGEDDPNRQTIDMAKLLLATPRIGKVDIIVRREHPDLEDIKNLVEANQGRLELALEPAEITARLVRCHFALTSGSGWSLELACIGVPQLLILQNEAHWPNAQRMEEEGCANILGWHENVSAQTIRLAVQNLLTDPLERQAMARCGRKLIDGRGPDRLVNALEIMLHRGVVREATAEAA